MLASEEGSLSVGVVRRADDRSWPPARVLLLVIEDSVEAEPREAVAMMDVRQARRLRAALDRAIHAAEEMR